VRRGVAGVDKEWQPVISGCLRRGEPIRQSGRRPTSPFHARDPPLLPTCTTMHRRSLAELPDLPHRPFQQADGEFNRSSTPPPG
jgi:hypothetical protein